jgi:hypothetical protein
MSLSTSVYVAPQTIAATANELQRIQRSKRDFIASAPKLRITNDMRMVMGDGNAEYVPAPMEMKRQARRQLQEKLGLYQRYEDRLLQRESDDAGFRELLVHNYNELLRMSDDKKFLVRTLDNNVRAVLSNSYRVVDNADLFFLAAEVFKNVSAKVCRLRLWDDGFEMFAMTERFFHEIQPERPDGMRLRINEVDFQYPAVRVYNSETGRGKLGVDIVTLTSMCVNLNVFGTAASSVHLGSRNNEEGDITYADDTLAAEGQAMALKLRDAITTTFDERKFRERMEIVTQATRRILPQPEQAVDNTLKLFSIGMDQKQRILQELYGSGDTTQYGLAQSVSWLSHQLDKEGNAELASTVEEVGGRIMSMPAGEFAQITKPTPIKVTASVAA